MNALSRRHREASDMEFAATRCIIAPLLFRFFQHFLQKR